MAGSKSLKLNNIWFDSAAASEAIMKIVQENLEACAEQLAQIIQEQIMANGHGSSAMKTDAASLVKHVLREASFQKVVYEAGITDEAMGSAAA